MSPSISVPLRLRLWASALLVVAGTVHLYDLATPGLLDRTGRLKGSDYTRLYVTGVLAREGRWAEFFDAGAHLRIARETIDPGFEMTGLHPNYSPAVGIALSPLTLLPFLDSWYLFSACSVAALLLACALALRRCSRLTHDPTTVALCALACPILHDTLRYGQLSAFTLLIFSAAAALWSRHRPLAAGVVLGLAWYKPNLLVGPALVFLLAGEWAGAGGLVLGGVAETIVNLACSNLRTMER